MRGKIIFVNAGILLLVGLLTYTLLSTSLSRVLQDRTARGLEAERALRSAAAQLALDGFRVERWLSAQVTGADVRAVYAGGTESARQQAATALADALHEAARVEPDFERMAPDLVLFVDSRGVGLGRNGSNLMRGERIADAYPSLAQALRTGATASDLWLHADRQEQWLASYAPVRADGGDVVGAVILGTPLTDDRLERTRDLTSGCLLLAGVLEGGRVRLLAHGGQAPAEVLAAVGQPAVAAVAQRALADGRTSRADVVAGGHLLGVTPLAGYGERAVLVAAVPASRVESMASQLWPVLAVTALGLLLVVISGNLLANYFQGPIGQIEEALLAIINGRTDLRLELEHAELGGLVSRINSLLDALTGVPEVAGDRATPSTDPVEGRVWDALVVDEGLSPAAPAAPEAPPDLDEPDSQHYRGVYQEFLAAKRGLGEPVDDVTEAAFTAWLRQRAQAVGQRHDRPVRFRVEVRGRTVILVAAPAPAPP